MAAAFWGGTIDPGGRSDMGGPNEKQLGFKNVFGWTDIHRNPPPIHLLINGCLLYTSPSPRDAHESRMPSSA